MYNSIIKQNKLIKYFILALGLVLVFTLSGCNGTKELDYNDFSEDHLLTWQQVLEKDEDQYLLYYYGVNCSHCKTIKADILEFASSNQAGLKVYFIDSGEVPTENLNMYPVYDPITSETVPGTPTMLVIVDGKLKAMEVGPTIIKDLLTKINDGSYGFIE